MVKKVTGGGMVVAFEVSDEFVETGKFAPLSAWVVRATYDGAAEWVIHFSFG